MRIVSALLTATLLAVIIPLGDAQARSRSRGVAPPAGAKTGSQRRGSDMYSVPRGSSGTIQWNTPNASGNLGGPGAGGGGGSGA